MQAPVDPRAGGGVPGADGREHLPGLNVLREATWAGTQREYAAMARNNRNSKAESTEYLRYDPGDNTYGGAHGVVAQELEYVKARRSRSAAATPGDKAGSSGSDAGDSASDLVALALSGGGIRSASFCLGIMQSLARAGWMRRLDYLSTVSGGGYIGTCLTWLLHQKIERERAFGLDPDDFPFGTRRAQGTAGFVPEKTAEGPATTAGMNAVLYWLRQHAEFLVPGHGLNLAALVGVLLGNVVVSLGIYFPLLCGAYFALLRLTNHPFQGVTAPASDHGTSLGLPPLTLGLASLGLMAVLSLVYALASNLFRSGQAEKLALRMRRWWAVAMGFLLMLAVFLLLAGSVSYVVEAVSRWVQDKSTVTALTGAATALVGMLPAWGAYRQGRSGAGGSWLAGPITAWLGGMLLIYGLLLLAHVGVLAATANAPLHNSPGWWYLILLLPLVVGATADMNSVSMHRYYRDRLMGTFLPQLAGDSVLTGGSEAADRMRLHDACRVEDARGPYHLINTNVVLVDAQDARFRGRGGDSFVLSPLYCGSSATGWRRTKEFMGGSVTLASAMATSGAALNPEAGVAGHGPTRNRALSFVLRMANVRLGYWVTNPGRPPGRMAKPKFLWPGLPALFGFGFRERWPFVELTDGGHFDNLGIYELVRRRCRLIIAVDAGADPKYQFDDLANAIERVRVDFGAKIAISGEDLRPLLPGFGETGRPSPAQHGWLYADVKYADGTLGTLIYITTTFTEGLPADLYGYKAAHPNFPDEPTSDQFFDEQQFEAYRELGYQITSDMLRSPRTIRESGDHGALAPLGLCAPPGASEVKPS